MCVCVACALWGQHKGVFHEHSSAAQCLPGHAYLDLGEVYTTHVTHIAAHVSALRSRQHTLLASMQGDDVMGLCS